MNIFIRQGIPIFHKLFQHQQQPLQVVAPPGETIVVAEIAVVEIAVVEIAVVKIVAAKIMQISMESKA